MNDPKKLAELIGALLSSDQDSEATLRRTFDHYIQASKNIGALVEVINFPIQRYYGRSSVHIAAFNGLPEYLEFLLQHGGTS